MAIADIYYRKVPYTGPIEPWIPPGTYVYDIYFRNDNYQWMYTKWDGYNDISTYCYVHLELVNDTLILPEDASILFSGCLNVTIDNIDKVDSSETTAFLGTFSNCHNLKSLDLSNWDMSNAKNLRGMFSGCPELEEINVTGWNVSKVWSMQRVFSDCPKLHTIRASAGTNWYYEIDWSGYAEYDEIFEGCVSLPLYDDSHKDFYRANTDPGEWDYDGQYWRSRPGFFTGAPAWYEFVAYEKVDDQWEPIEMRTWYQRSEYLNPKWAETVIYNKGSWK